MISTFSPATDIGGRGAKLRSTAQESAPFRRRSERSRRTRKSAPAVDDRKERKREEGRRSDPRVDVGARDSSAAMSSRRRMGGRVSVDLKKPRFDLRRRHGSQASGCSGKIETKISQNPTGRAEAGTHLYARLREPWNKNEKDTGSRGKGFVDVQHRLNNRRRIEDRSPRELSHVALSERMLANCASRGRHSGRTPIAT
jgi:hypothetical protein